MASRLAEMNRAQPVEKTLIFAAANWLVIFYNFAIDTHKIFLRVECASWNLNGIFFWRPPGASSLNRQMFVLEGLWLQREPCTIGTEILSAIFNP